MTAVAIANLVHETSTGTGTGSFTLTAVNGKQTFDQAFGHGATPDVFYYFISNRDAAEWEEGTGHLSSASVLVRDTVQNSSNANVAVNFTAGTKDVVNDLPAAYQVSPGTGTAREILLADRTYYVRTDGNDSNNGLTNTSGGAFLTMQKAWNATCALDQSIYPVTIQVADGTYAAGIDNEHGETTPTGAVTITGNTTTPGNVIAQGTHYIFDLENIVDNVTIQGFTFQAQAANAFGIVLGTCLHVNVLDCGFAANGQTGFGGMLVQDVFRLFVGGTITFVGNAAQAFRVLQVYDCFILPGAVVFSGSVAFSIAFLYASFSNVTYYDYGRSGSATGPYYNLINNTYLNAYGYTLPGGSNGSKDEGSYIVGAYQDLWTTAPDGGLRLPSVLNFPVTSAPASPVDGDIWRQDNTNTGLKVRVNGVTKTITLS